MAVVATHELSSSNSSGSTLERTMYGLRIDLVAARREPAGAAPEHTLSIESTLSW